MIARCTTKPSRRRRSAAVIAVAVLSLGVRAQTSATSHSRGAEDAEAAGRQALEKWIETRRLISRERHEWRAQKEILEGRVSLLRREIEAQEQQIAQTSNDLAEVDRKLEELRAQQAVLAAGTAGLHDAVTNLEARVLALLDHGPAPLRDHLRPLSQRIPKDGASRATLSERFQNVVGVLNEVNKFARDLHIVSEVRDMPDGSRTEVTVLYIGLAHAYYVNAAGGVAGVGRPGKAGWIWERDDSLVPQVADLIAVHRNEKPAVYVTLPVTIQ